MLYHVFFLGMWGNESDGVIEVCLFPWSKDTLPTPKDIITMFHFHPELSNNPMESTTLSDDEPATRNIAVFTAGMPAKLNSSQLRRHAGGKD